MKAISNRILQVIQPEQLQIAVSAVEHVEKRTKVISEQWRMKIQRAEYEAQLAQKKYGINVRLVNVRFTGYLSAPMHESELVIRTVVDV